MCDKKLLIDVFFVFFLFLIGIKLNKGVTELFMKIFLWQYSALIDIQQICNKAVLF